MAIVDKITQLYDKLDECLQSVNKEEKKVMVSGCYDLIHAGHIKFFNEASKYGKLYVRIGTDDNIRLLKNHDPMFNELERLYIVRNIKSVYNAELCSGKGMLDFEPDLDIIKPDIFFVNEDGDRISKRELCLKKNIQYIVSKREPEKGLNARSSTDIKACLQSNNHQNEHKNNNNNNNNNNHDDEHKFPWRICLAGGWLDQPWVSKLCNGSVIVINIQHHPLFKTRSGLGTSTRECGIKLWGGQKPPKGTTCEQAAKYLFGAENPPGSQYVSGSQDALGLLLPGINRLDYNGDYWPYQIETLDCKQYIKNIQWLESILWLVPAPSRPNGYNPLKIQHLNSENAKKIADACTLAWKSIIDMDIKNLGQALTNTLYGWKSLLPETVPDDLKNLYEPYLKQSYGLLFTGAGGGFFIIVSDKPIDNGFQIKINYENWCEN